MNTDKRSVEEVWRDYWIKNKEKDLFLDKMSEAILHELLKNYPNIAGKKILETGCGRGVISAELAMRGAHVYLLDVSTEALQIAQKYFISKGLNAHFIHGDIFDLDLKGAIFDIVWNAGVIEHFEGEDQLRALRNIASIIKIGGFFISFNPFEGARFYKLGKRIAEKKGRWPYGPEFPVKSLAEKCDKVGLKVLREYPICFKENLSYLSYVSKHLRSLIKFLLKPFPERFLIKLLGGYLLVTVAVKKQV